MSDATLRELRQKNWTAAQWERLLAVYAEQGSVMTDIGLPAMLGTHFVGSRDIRFEPQFPLTPGVSYRVLFHPGQLPGGPDAGKPVTSVFKLPPAAPTRPRS